MKRSLEILFFLLAFGTPTAQAQDSLSATPNVCGWMALSLGPATGRDFYGMSGAITLNYLKDSRILSMRFLYAEKAATAEPLGQFNTSTTRLNSVTDVGFLYGLASKSRYFLLSISAGLGYVWGRNLEHNSLASFRSPAIPIEIQIGLSPLKAIGVSAYVFANLNFNSSFFGTMFCVQIGKVQ